MILTLAVSGYRSLRDLVLPLGPLNVVTGANGSGKSSLYRALRLLADVAQGRLFASLAAEGGLQSTLWAGPETIARGVKSGRLPVEGTVRRHSISLKLGFASDDFGYAIDLGLPVLSASRFGRDPEIKTETVWAGPVLRRGNVLAARRGPGVQVTEDKGSSMVLTNLPAFDSMMTHAADPRRSPELLTLRERMRGWRFYDHFRTDAEAPARRPQVGTRTTVLSADGSDLAAAWLTIEEIGNPVALAAAVEDAFPGAGVGIEEADGLFEVRMRQHGLLRPLRAAELSDGTLRYLLLIAALMTPRPPELLVLNEPETSLHPDLLPALARLIANASDRSQVIVVSHALPLVAALTEQAGAMALTLSKELGETVVAEAERPAWAWPQR